jgi:hypothetical protein
MDKICIGVPAYGAHSAEVALRLASVTGQLHYQDIVLERIISPFSMMADANRNRIAKTFLEETTAEWLFFMDTDNEIPTGGIRRLLDVDRTIVSGAYYLKASPFTPVAYWRQADGRYRPVSNFVKGEILEVDMVGLGCILIHRSVFESIARNYVPFQRRFGGTVMIHRGDILDVLGGQPDNPDVEKAGKLQGNIFYDVLDPVPDDIADPVLPIFRMEYNRTEDVGFCEMENVADIRYSLTRASNRAIMEMSRSAMKIIQAS